MAYIVSLVAAIIVALILDFGLLEVALLIALAIFAGSSKARRSRMPARWMSAVRRIARRPVLAYGTILALAILPRAAFLAATGLPVPFIPDEFSYLLLADTLESGRLSNPVHPQWVFFETVHVIPEPAYQSQYLPGTAVFLALGRKVFGHEGFGVWLGSILLFPALLWALRGWFPPLWAWFACALATVRFGVGGSWVDSYWGGAIPALGGVLMAGSVAGTVMGRRFTWVEGLAFGAGASILLSTRPWEGAALGLGCCGLLLWALWRRKGELAQFVTRFALPATILLAACALGLAKYNAAVTGSATTMPYQISQKLYGWPMTLPWMKPDHREFRHPQMRLYHKWERLEHTSITSIHGFLMRTPYKASIMWRFFLGPMLSVFPWVIFRHRRWKGWPLLFVCTAPVFLAVFIEQSWYPHYLAPAFAAVIGIWVIGLRELHKLRLSGKGRSATFAGWFLVLVIPAHFGLLGLAAASRAAGWNYQPSYNILSWCCREGGPLNRAKAEHEILSAAPDPHREKNRHLVFVSTPKDRLNPVQWVYNRAGIDASPIVWAWDLGEEQNAGLLRYYPGRKPWRVFADQNGYILLPYETPFPDLTPRLTRLGAQPDDLKQLPD